MAQKEFKIVLYVKVNVLSLALALSSAQNVLMVFILKTKNASDVLINAKFVMEQVNLVVMNALMDTSY